MHLFGQLAAVGTAVCWSICGPCFTLAGQRIGSLAVNFHRLVLAGLLLSLCGWLFRGHALPLDASAETWYWLSASGLVGFFLCDLCLFRSFLLIGPRVALLIMSLSPLIAVVIEWLFRDERLSAWSLAGMAVTLFGVALVLAERRRRPMKSTAVPTTDGDDGDDADDADADPNYIEVDTAASSLTTAAPVDDEHADANKPTHPPESTPDQRRWTIGLLLALIATVAQAVGMVFAKVGIKDYDLFAATQIRLNAGLLGFYVIITFARRWKRVMHGLTNGRAMIWLTLGAITGPFLGVSLGLFSLKHIPTGPAMTLMSLTPILILPLSKYLLGDHVSLRAVTGAAIAVVGVAMLFLL